MSDQDYLIRRGWKQGETNRRMWVDPQSQYDLCPTEIALMVQHERDAARLDTALTALELAERALAYHTAFCFKTDSKEQVEGRDALAAVRAAREGGKQ
jgi:hypothetical protein